MSGTTVIYNDVRIKDCQTLRFEQQVHYDESDTDTVYSKFSIRVAGNVHPDQLNNHAVQFGETELTVEEGKSYTLMQLLQQRLSHPRGEFFFYVDDDVLLYSTSKPDSRFVDFNNGPKPRSVEINQIVGTRVFRIEFEIEITAVKCAVQYTNLGVPEWPPAALKDAKVVNNRWSVSEERDSNFHQQRTIEGVLQVKHATHWPQTFRYLVVPPLTKGYQRVRQRFSDTKDGLKLHYTIVDKQRSMAPPSPATDWVATHTESSGYGDSRSYGEMRVILMGEPDTKKQELLQAAVAVVLERLRGLNALRGSDDFSYLLHLAVIEHLHQNRIEVSAQCLNTNIEEAYLNTRIARISDNMESAYLEGYDRKEWPKPSAYAHSKVAGLWCHYWQDPCIDVHGIPGAERLSYQPSDQTGDDEGEGTQTIFDQTTGNPLNDEDQTVESADQRAFPYTYFRLETDFNVETGNIQLPLSGVQDNRTPQRAKTCAILNVHAGLAQREIVLHGERIGRWPNFPEPREFFTDNNGIQYYLLKYKLAPDIPKTMPDGKTKMYRVQARYVYAMTRVPLLTDKLWIGADPRVLAASTDTVLNLKTIFDGRTTL